jgi:hypothetical protein
MLIPKRLRRALILPAIIVATLAAGPAGVPTEPPLTCKPLTVVNTSIGKTVKTLGPGKRIVQIVWSLSDGHLYISQTGDNAASASTTAEKASSELQPRGTIVSLCTDATTPKSGFYLIRTKNGENRAATRIH